MLKIITNFTSKNPHDQRDNIQIVDVSKKSIDLCFHIHRKKPSQTNI